LKDRIDQINIESSTFERKHHSLKREVGTLATQVDAALYTNAKLNVLIPNQVRMAIEEEAASKNEKPQVEEKSHNYEKSQVEEKPHVDDGSGGHDSHTKDEILFDTSVSLDIGTDKGTAEE